MPDLLFPVALAACPSVYDMSIHCRSVNNRNEMALIRLAPIVLPLVPGSIQGHIAHRDVTKGQSMALSDAERAKSYRDRRRAAVEPVIRFRLPKDRRTRPKLWADATGTLLAILDDYQTWRDGMPEGVASSATAEKLDSVLELRELVEQLEAAELPKGFGRDG
jgi:hypothetical protein